ncbi:MAG: hypothetical protein IPP71_02365 [Bacteroidetes bacterium]|nr:hypothetical protein [Bacteroidota bacterium]
MNTKICTCFAGIIFLLLSFFSSVRGQGLEWAVGFGSSYQNFGLNIAGDFVAVDDSGNVFITGLYLDSVDFDPGPGVTLMVPQGNDAFIVKLDASGNFVWVKTFTGSGSLEPDELIFDHQGNLLLTGRFIYDVDFDPGPATAIETVSNVKRFALVKLTSDGDLIWYRISEPSLPMGWGASIVTNIQNEIFVLGTFVFQGDVDPGPGVYTIVADTSNQIYVMKLDSFGNFVWVKTTSGIYNSYVRPNDLKMDSQGSIYVTGWFRDSVDFDPGVAENYMVGAGYSDAFY